MKYHIAHRNGDQLSLRLELRGLFGTELPGMKVIGNFVLISSDSSKTKKVYFAYEFDKNRTISDWYSLAPRKEILDPKNGYYNQAEDVVLVDNNIHYLYQ